MTRAEGARVPDPAGFIYSVARSPAPPPPCGAMDDEYAECHRVPGHEPPCCQIDSIVLADPAGALAKHDAEVRAGVLREAADEMWRVFLRLPRTPSPIGDYVQRQMLAWRAEADRIEAQP